MSVKQWSLVGVSGLLLAAISGCATAPRLSVEPMPESLKYSETVSFGENINVPFVSTVANPGDADEVILFALSLSERGRHLNAARFFADAASHFRSVNNELEVALLSAAANEYLKGGDMHAFRETIRQLRSSATRYQYAAFDKHTAALVSLGDIAFGGTQATELTPAPLRDLHGVKGSK